MILRSHLHRPPLHLISHIDVCLRKRDAAATCRNRPVMGCQYASAEFDRDTLISKLEI